MNSQCDANSLNYSEILFLWNRYHQKCNFSSFNESSKDVTCSFYDPFLSGDWIRAGTAAGISDEKFLVEKSDGRRLCLVLFLLSAVLLEQRLSSLILVATRKAPNQLLMWLTNSTGCLNSHRTSVFVNGWLCISFPHSHHTNENQSYRA